MSVVAGVDIGNATTEVVVLDGERLLGADRLPTRGRKGSADSLRGAAALVRRIERRLGTTVAEARIAPLRAVGTATLTIPAAVPDTGRLRVLAAGVATPGGTGTCVGEPLWLDGGAGREGPAGAAADGRPPDGGPAAWVALVPASLGYVAAARRLRGLLAAGVPVGAVLAGSDEGVLIANRLGASVPVIDQIDVDAAAACGRLAVEVRRPGQPMTLLTDPVALAAALRLGDAEAGDAATVSRALLDYGNGVVGLAAEAAPGPGGRPGPATAGRPGSGRPGAGRAVGRGARPPDRPAGRLRRAGGLAGRHGHRARHPRRRDQPGRPVRGGPGRRGRHGHRPAGQRGPGRAGLVAAPAQPRPRPRRRPGWPARLPGRCVLSEPAAARLGACTTPGARPDAVVVDVGAGTIDVIAPDGEVVAAGAGELLTVAVAETLGMPRAAADWVKRGPCVRLDGNQRFEAEDGSRGFLDGPADPAAAGMLAAAGPAGWLPFDRGHSPAEWRAIRLRLKEAVFAANLARALRSLGRDLGQVLIVGGPAGDDELLGVLLRTLPDGVTAGRGNVGGTLAGPAAGHRHAAALGLALAPPT